MNNWKTWAIAILTLIMINGCVSKKVFQEEIKARDERIASLESEMEKNESRLDEHEKLLSELSNTSKEALTRAEEAGKLAEGKFLYEVTLSDDRCRFSLNQTTLNDECKEILDDLIERLKNENKNVYIEIQGHTDSLGDEDLNYLIGKKRAEAVYNYLGTHGGIPLHRMNVISYGESQPIADNSTPEGRKQNRRVVIVVLK